MPAGIATVLSVLRSSALVVDEQDEVCKASAPAYALGSCAGSQLTVRGAGRPRPAGAPRRPDPRDRARHLRVAGRRRPARHRARRTAEQPAGAGADRGPHPRAARRGDPPGLRGQRLPRAQDARSARSTCSPRRCRRRPTTRRRWSGSRAGCRPRAPGWPSWCSRSSSCRGCRATTRSRSPRRSTSTSVVDRAIDQSTIEARSKEHRDHAQRRARSRDPRQRRRDRTGAGQPGRQRGRLLARGQQGRRRRQAPTS